MCGNVLIEPKPPTKCWHMSWPPSQNISKCYIRKPRLKDNNNSYFFFRYTAEFLSGPKIQKFVGNFDCLEILIIKLNTLIICTYCLMDFVSYIYEDLFSKGGNESPTDLHVESSNTILVTVCIYVRLIPCYNYCVTVITSDCNIKAYLY